jgi:hypothetical protein
MAPRASNSSKTMPPINKSHLYYIISMGILKSLKNIQV